MGYGRCPEGRFQDHPPFELFWLWPSVHEMDLKGYVDAFQGTHLLSGWLRDRTNGPVSNVHVKILRHGQVIGRCVPTEPRPDVAGAFSFDIITDAALSSDDIISGTASVIASDGEITWEIPYFPGFIEKLKERVEHDRLLANLSNELSGFSFRVGAMSPDEVALVGYGGHLFLRTGSNDLLGAYGRKRGDPFVVAASGAWLKLMAERRRQIEDLGARYLQIILPEKSTVLQDLFPIPIEGPTVLFSAIEEATNEAGLSDNVLNCLGPLAESIDRDLLYYYLNSHFSPNGSSLIFSLILKALGLPRMQKVEFHQAGVISGDLGRKFGAFLSEVKYWVALEGLVRYESGLEQIEASESQGEHIGTRAVYSNSSSACPLRVVAFANSFFERGSNPAQLSWWAARWFREFHFVWSPDVDYEYIQKVNPDVVICQTIERFLPHIPVS